jgi:hypothetical protein
MHQIDFLCIRLHKIYYQNEFTFSCHFLRFGTRKIKITYAIHTLLFDRVILGVSVRQDARARGRSGV